MTIFFILAALMVIVCLLWMLLGMNRSRSQSLDQESVNITLAREKRQTLDKALAENAIDQATYDDERELLEIELAKELNPADAESATKDGRLGAAILITVFVPIAAGALYLELGDPSAITHTPPINSSAANQQPPAGNDSTAPALADLLPQLEERLAKTPDDVNGWRLLGRSYLSVGEFNRAENALRKAIALEESNVATLAQLAESIAMQRAGNLAGEPMQILAKANSLDAQHEHTLWLLSIGKQQAGDHDGALQGFNQLSLIAQDNPEALATIEQMRSRSVQALSELAVRNTQTQPSETGTAVTPQKSDTPSTQTALNVSVSIDASVLETVNESQSVFVYAKAVSGPPMPLAVSRLTVKDLPTTVKLDDSMAMIPTMKLSNFDSIVVGARISATGNAIAQSGDWYNESAAIDTESTSVIDLVINRQVP